MPLDHLKPKMRARALLEAILTHARDLGLSDSQMAATSRIYWDVNSDADAGLTVTKISELLTVEQFRDAVAQFTVALHAPSADNSDLPVEIEGLVLESLNNATKDRSIVEIQLAANATNILIGWAKNFAFFVALPASIFLGSLVFYGISKVTDIREKADSVSKDVGLIQQTVEGMKVRRDQLRIYAQDYANMTLSARNMTIRDLQIRLRDKGYEVSTSGDFDESTYVALQKFQADTKTIPDGLLGLVTIANLFPDAQPADASAKAMLADFEARLRSLEERSNRP